MKSSTSSSFSPLQMIGEMDYLRGSFGSAGMGGTAASPAMHVPQHQHNPQHPHHHMLHRQHSYPQHRPSASSMMHDMAGYGRGHSMDTATTAISNLWEDPVNLLSQHHPRQNRCTFQVFLFFLLGTLQILVYIIVSPLLHP